MTTVTSDNRSHLTIFAVRPSEHLDAISNFFEELGFDLNAPDATLPFTTEIVETNTDTKARAYMDALGATVPTLLIIEPPGGADECFGISNFKHWLLVFLDSIRH